MFSENIYYEIFKSSRSIMIITDPSTGEIADANDSASTFYGYSLEMLRQIKISQLNALGLEEINAEMECAKADGRNYFAFVHRLSNGEVRDVEVFSNGFESDGRALCYSIIHDVTLRIKQKEKAYSARSVFLGNMSHELRTPMNGILGMLQLMEMTSVDEEQKEYLDIMKNSSRRMISLINNLMTFTMLESGNIESEIELCNVQEVLNEVIDHFSETARKNKIELLIKVDHTIEKGYADWKKIKIILEQILDNALKFTQEGYVEISVNADKEDGIINFNVKDTGIGMDKKDLHKIFESFEQLENSYTKKYQGAGLGLAITKRLADLMGASLLFEGKRGEGALFTLKIKMDLKQKILT